MKKRPKSIWNDQLRPKPKQLTEHDEDFTELKLSLFNTDG